MIVLRNMVIMMHINKQDLLHKPRLDSAPTLHRLFDKDSAPIKIPSAYDLILERLQFYKWSALEYELFCDIENDVELQELMKAINIDWNDIDTSVVDEVWKNKTKNLC